MKNEIISSFLEKYDIWFASNGQDFFKQEEKNERLLAMFLKDFSVENVISMKIDDYVVGKGLDSFCKWVEVDLKDYGAIIARKLNAWQKFSIFYNAEKNCYEHGVRFGKDTKTVFNNVKEAVLAIIYAAQTHAYKVLASSKLNPLFKNKIFFLYNSNDSLPIYSEKDLNTLLTVFSIPFDNDVDRAYKRKLLFDFYKSLNRDDISTFRFMRFVYNPMGYRSVLRAEEAAKLNSDIETKIYSLVDVERLENGVFFHSDDEKTGLVVEKPESVVQKKITGKRGEEIVKAYLLSHKQELLIDGEVDCACEYSDYKHFDFSYLETNGRRVFVEVKATKINDKSRISFEMSEEEYLFMLANIDNYYFFYINDVFNGTIIKRISAKKIVPKPCKYRILMVIDE